MIKSKIEEAIENHSPIVIEYRNADNNVSIHRLCNLKSQTKGLVLAYSEQWKKELCFKIDRIQEVYSWTKLHEQEDVASENGIYVFACMGDNLLVYEMYQLQKDDNLWKYFIGEFSHADGWNPVIPVAYYFIPFYKLDSCCGSWSVPPNDTNIARHVCIFSYKRSGVTEYGFISHDDKYPNQLKLLYDNNYWSERESYFDNVEMGRVYRIPPYVTYESVKWYVRYY